MLLILKTKKFRFHILNSRLNKEKENNQFLIFNTDKLGYNVNPTALKNKNKFFLEKELVVKENCCLHIPSS